jgi:hypothetical protein
MTSSFFFIGPGNGIHLKGYGWDTNGKEEN